MAHVAAGEQQKWSGYCPEPSTRSIDAGILLIV